MVAARQGQLNASQRRLCLDPQSSSAKHLHNHSTGPCCHKSPAIHNISTGRLGQVVRASSNKEISTPAQKTAWMLLNNGTCAKGGNSSIGGSSLPRNCFLLILWRGCVCG